MTFRAAIAAAVLVLASCGSDHRVYCDPTTAGVGQSDSRADKSFRFDSTVDDATRAAFLSEAGPRWAAVAKYEFSPAFQPNGNWLIQVRTLHPACSGTTDLAAKVIAVAPGLYPDALRAAATHELGHAILGAEHLPDGTVGVMNRAATDTELSVADLALCRRVGACD
jgi:hypothetical protein